MTDYELLQALDRSAEEVTPWEADFLESLLRRGSLQTPTPRQRHIMHQMAEKYLPPHTVAEWLGQQRLFSE